jgi:surface antigen
MRPPVALVVTLATLAVPAASPGRLPAPIVTAYPYASLCPAAGFNNDKVDRWNMYACNCTSFAAWVLDRNGQRTDWFVAGEMDAHNWPSVARRKGLATGNTPRLGSIAVWPDLVPPWGHLAYVTRLDGDGRFDVAEYNLLVPFRFDRRTEVSLAGVTFVYVPRRRS